MKSAKEWAESVVVDPECDGIRWAARIEDPSDRAWFESEGLVVDALEGADRARAIVERLVERVQADARAPLEEEIAQRDRYIRGLQREVNEWYKIASDRGLVLGDVADALEELRGVAVPGSTADAVCERLLPKIEEALR